MRRDLTQEDIKNLTPDDITTIEHLMNEMEIEGYKMTFNAAAKAYLESLAEIEAEEKEALAK